jgi:glycosyltransferase involved in cell wall biosynthesis
MYLTTSNFVSVVIPSYNHARYLREAVESVIAQTHIGWEIVIVDDGSTDNTVEVAEQLIAEHSTKKIRLVRKKNGGPADARNAGISVALGGWILPLDGDDKIAPTFLEKAFYLAENIPGTNFVYSDLQEFEERHDAWAGSPYSLSTIMSQNTFPCCSMFKRELWGRSGGYPRDFPWGAEDYSFWLSLAQLGLKVQRIAEPLFLYRYKEAGNCSSLVNRHWTTFEPMMYTLHSAIYPSRMLAIAHEQIGAMSAEYFEGLKKKVSRFPDLAYPHFWMGLKYEADDHPHAALESYKKFCQLHFSPDWQVLWRELLCRVKIKDMSSAHRCYNDLTEGFPELGWIKEVTEPLFAGAMA